MELQIIYHQLVIIFLLAVNYYCSAWMPDTSSKLIKFNRINSIRFKGNTTFPDHFTVLYQDDSTILLGGRNRIYNLSIYDFTERKESSIDWPSSEAHGQLCSLKGKSEEDCQNYIRILFNTTPGKLLICGTNSYKPLCRTYMQKNGKFVVERDLDGVGLCPFDPEHNSTAIYTNGQLFSATVADFSGTDPLIYRDPLRTELSDLKQLNAPNFVSTITHEDYVYFFYREIAVEYMNCGKVIYSRVARVCKHDKGGSHQFRNKWTTFVKARLNCSVSGEYPFYFDEIQSTSELIEGKYGSTESQQVIYGALTTPTNAIGGSAICMYNMQDILKAFRGSFKHQESINSNWLPVPEDKVPKPRPGECVSDSRVLPDKNVNFIKTHSLMEDAVPAMFGRPILIRVSLHYRFTAIVVDAQVPGVNEDNQYDVVYVGTDDGKVIKIVNIPEESSAKGVIISENEVFSNGAAVKQLRLAPGNGKVVAVGKEEVKLVTLTNCHNINRCNECIELRDPHCAWDSLKASCVSVDTVTANRYLLQDIRHGNSSKCKNLASEKAINNAIIEPEISNNVFDEASKIDPLLISPDPDVDCNSIDSLKRTGCSVQNKFNLYTPEHLHIIVALASVIALFVGFICGFFVSRRFHPQNQYPNSPFNEHHNPIDKHNSPNSFLTPKSVNIPIVNVSVESLPPKKENLGSTKNLNITNEGTLQKIKKTYI